MGARSHRASASVARAAPSPASTVADAPPSRRQPRPRDLSRTLLRRRAARRPRARPRFSPRAAPERADRTRSADPSARQRHRRRRRDAASYELLTLAAELYRARFGHLAYDRQDFLLRRFDFGQAHRTFRLEIVLEHLGGALRHVLVDLR